MANFAFLTAEFPAVREAAVEAECQAGARPTAEAFFGGKAVTVAVKGAFRTDPGFSLVATTKLPPIPPMNFLFSSLQSRAFSGQL